MGGPFPIPGAASTGFGAMISPWLGPLGFLASVLGRRKRDRSSAQFHQRMQDMEAYGIHPLAAIGGSGMSGIGQGAVQTNDMVGPVASAAQRRQAMENARDEKQHEEDRVDRHRREDKEHDINIVGMRSAANQEHGLGMLQPFHPHNLIAAGAELLPNDWRLFPKEYKGPFSHNVNPNSNPFRGD